jgi:hypothetical protein
MSQGGGTADLSNDIIQRIQDSTKSIMPTNEIMKKLATQGRISRPSLGIFGSLSSQIIVNYTDIADNLNLQA